MNEDPIWIFAKMIRSLFEEGIPVGTDVAGFIDATFSNPTPDELCHILEDEENTEKGPLMELLFFPDFDIQVRFEDFLSENGSFFAGDSDRITASVAGLLMEKPLSCGFFFQNDVFEVPVSEENLLSFLARLRMDNNPDPFLVDQIREQVKKGRDFLFRVRLRNFPRPLVQNEIDFLTACVNNLEMDSTRAVRRFDFLLRFLDECDSDNIHERLIQKRNLLIQYNEKAEKIERQITKGNMETMMMAGIRHSGWDRRRASEEADFIGEVLRLVFYQPVSDFIGKEILMEDTASLMKNPVFFNSS